MMVWFKINPHNISPVKYTVLKHMQYLTCTCVQIASSRQFSEPDDWFDGSVLRFCVSAEAAGSELFMVQIIRRLYRLIQWVVNV